MLMLKGRSKMTNTVTNVSRAVAEELRNSFVLVEPEVGPSDDITPVEKKPMEAPYGWLCDYYSGCRVRPALEGEAEMSKVAADAAPYTGVVKIDNQLVYVES
jgi:hypothetical protein